MLEKLIAWAWLAAPLVIYTALPYPQSWPRFLFINFLLLATGTILFFKKTQLKINWLDGYFLFFILILAATAGLGANPLNSFWGPDWRSFGVIFWIILAGLYLFLKQVEFKKSTLIIGGYFVSVASMLLIGYLQIIFPGFLPVFSESGVGGTLGNSIYYGAYLVLAFFGLAFFYKTAAPNNNWQRWSSIVLILLILPVLYFTRARGAWAALFLGIVATALIILFFKIKSKFKILFTVVLLFFILAAGSLAIQKYQFASRSLQIRLAHWQLTWTGIKTRPLLGWGWNNYSRVLETFSIYPIQHAQAFNEIQADTPHNGQLEIILSAGIVGFIFYLLFIGTAFYYLWQLKKSGALSPSSAAILAGLLVAYQVQLFFLFETSGPIILWLFFLAIISQQKSASDQTANLKISGMGQKIFAGTLVVFALGVFWSGGSINSRPHDFTSWQLVADRAFLVGAGEKELTALAAATEKISQAYPNDFRTQLFSGIYWYQLSQKTGRTEFQPRAEAALLQAEKIAPHRPEPLIQQAQLKILEKDFVVADQLLVKAIGNAPEYAPLHWLRAELAFVQKNKDLSISEANIAVEQEPSLFKPKLEDFLARWR